jgi:hypothetical protein
MTKPNQREMYILGETLKAEAAILQSAINELLEEKGVDTPYAQLGDSTAELVEYCKPADRTYHLAVKMARTVAESSDEDPARDSSEPEAFIKSNTELPSSWSYRSNESLSGPMKAVRDHDNARRLADQRPDEDPKDVMRSAMNDYEELVRTARKRYGLRIPVPRVGYEPAEIVEETAEVLEEPETGKGIFLDER